MEVLPITPRGYCKGVVRAIDIAKKSIQKHQDVYILGMIVHNQYIVDALQALGVKTIDKKGATRLELLDEIDSGTIIISAHGASQEVFQKAEKKGLTIIDATCIDVINTHTLIQTYLEQGLEILYIGKKGHPESEGAISINTNKIHLIEKKEDIDLLNIHTPYALTNQTTMSLYDIYDISEYAKEKLSNVEIVQEVCTATKIRQEAIATIDKTIDAVFIVGDPHSHNSKKLASIASKKENRDVYMIESVRDIKISMLEGKKRVAVSSGASTPTYLTNQVLTYLKNFEIDKPETHALPRIDSKLIL